MPNLLSKVLMLLMTVFFVYRTWLTVKRKVNQNPEFSGLAGITFMAGAVLMLCLAVNALAFLQSTYVNWLTMAQQEVWDVSGRYAGTRATRFHLCLDQINIFIGTGYMMGMIRDAAAFKNITPASLSKISGMDVLDNMLRRLVVHHWWLIGGMVCFFGFTSGAGMVLFLAIELTIMWGGVKFGARVVEYKARERK